MKKEYYGEDHISFEDKSNHEKHGLRGVVQIYRRNKETGEVSFWDESSNIIPISGYQWILMKMFGLFLDSSHGKITDNLTRDTTLAIPDLNNRLNIGTSSKDYSVMDDNIAMNHICQGFMVGNGGAGEDVVTTKNTAYNFISLRNPIPFQQVSAAGFNPTIAGKYLGIYNGTSNSGISSAYIKKFDTTPHIYHSWWVDGQRWDYLDKVTEAYLGPDSSTGTPKTNRIETYVECKLSLSDTDCVAYFQHEGINETSMINELGLVAYDSIPGERSIIENCYYYKIQDFLKLVYKPKGDVKLTAEDNAMLKALCKDIHDALDPIIFSTWIGPQKMKQQNIINFISWIPTLTEEEVADETLSYDDAAELHSYDDVADSKNMKISNLQLAFSDDKSNIGAFAYYNQNDTIQYVTDMFMEYLQKDETSSLTTDEAQRIKLVTYYTFNSIPISKNWEILINYRIYAN